MAESSAADPGAIWRDLIAQWEKGFNNLANQTMGSGEFSRYMNQAMTLSMKMQNSMGEGNGPLSESDEPSQSRGNRQPR